MPVVAERFVQARLAKGWKTQEECARNLNSNQRTIAAIERGATKHPRQLSIWAKELGVSQSWLLGESDDPNPSTPKIKAHAFPILKMNEIQSWLESPILKPTHRIFHMYSSENNVSNLSFFIEIEGDSMISSINMAESYFPGHFALIDPKIKPSPGQVVLSKIGDSLKLRKLTTDGTESVLTALNSNYPIIKITKEVEIIGSVIWSARSDHPVTAPVEPKILNH